MSYESHTDLLARYVLCLFERVEQLEREVTALRLESVPSFEVLANLPEAPKQTQLERLVATAPRKSADRPLSKRDPAIAERWRKLVV